MRDMWCDVICGVVWCDVVWCDMWCDVSILCGVIYVTSCVAVQLDYVIGPFT